MKLFTKSLILFIKIYKYLVSTYLITSCRYQTTCSDYFIDCLKLNGLLKGVVLGIKRIFRCHPFKFLGGSSGFDPAPQLKKKNK